MERLRRVLQVAVAAVVLAVGVGLMVGMIRTKPVPPRLAPEPRFVAVDVISIEHVLDATPIVGYGTVRPARIVPIVSQTSGRLLRAHSHLAAGKTIAKGEVLFEIDATLADTARRQAQAEVQALETALKRCDKEAETLADRIADARQSVGFDESDYQSAKRLLDVEGIGNGRDVDLLQQKFLRQRGLLKELQAAFDTLPLTRTETQLRLDAARAQLDRAEHELAGARIVCPFEARVEQVNAQESQVVIAGQAIAVLSELGLFEVAAAVDTAELAWLHRDVRPVAIASAVSATAPVARVTCAMDGFKRAWPATVARFERVDEFTRAAKIAVEIGGGQGDVAKVNGMHDIDLVPGMYCRIELPAEPRTQAIRIPRAAIHEDRFVYVAEPSEGADDRIGRLARREVPILRTVGDQALVDFLGRDSSTTCELRPGDRLIVSPMLKPVPGMRVRAIALDPPALAGAKQ